MSQHLEFTFHLAGRTGTMAETAHPAVAPHAADDPRGTRPSPAPTQEQAREGTPDSRREDPP
ncbi:hypothetical protein GCM10023175_57200 [Pseudonocardia xishanensis]|uniref:Uncharacterized protein n=1 Tax=Pseudonocardia xishanensis TaxID=630995 RepID=A0ABP8S104_9PSEU